MDILTSLNNINTANQTIMQSGLNVYLAGIMMFFGGEIKQLVVYAIISLYGFMISLFQHIFFTTIVVTDPVSTKYIKIAISKYEIMKDYNYEISYDVYNKSEYRIESKVDVTRPFPFRYGRIYFYVKDLEDGIEIKYFKLFGSRVDLPKFIKDCKIIYDDFMNEKNYYNKEYKCMEFVDKKWLRVKRINMINVDTLFWSKDITKIMEDVEQFVKNKKFYLMQNTPYKRGYLLHGKPGTGKTTCARIIAAMFDYDIYCISFAQIGLTDDDIKKAMLQVPAKSIILLEDIDVTMIKTNKDKNQTKDGVLLPQKTIALSTLLNVIDGITTKFNTIFFITTNHFDLLKSLFDDAFFRSGRIDLIHEIGYLDLDETEKFFGHFYKNIYHEKDHQRKIDKYAKIFRVRLEEINKHNFKTYHFGLAHLQSYLNKHPTDFRQATISSIDLVKSIYPEATFDGNHYLNSN